MIAFEKLLHVFITLKKIMKCSICKKKKKDFNHALLLGLTTVNNVEFM